MVKIGGECALHATMSGVSADQSARRYRQPAKDCRISIRGGQTARGASRMVGGSPQRVNLDDSGGRTIRPVYLQLRNRIGRTDRPEVPQAALKVCHQRC